MSSISDDSGVEPAKSRQARRREIRKVVLNKVGLVVLRALARGIPRLPRSWTFGLSRALELLLRAGFNPRSRAAIRNMQLVYGDKFSPRELWATARQMWANAILILLDDLWLGGHSREIPRLVELQGVEYLQQAMAAGHGAILFTGHIGNWPAAGARLAADGFPIINLMRRRKSQAADEFIWEALGRLGYECIGTEEGLWPLIRLLKANKVLGFVGDNPADPEQGIEVSFFGHRSYMWATPIALSMATHAVVLPAMTTRHSDGHFTVRIFPPIEIERTASKADDVVRAHRKLVNWLEEQILADPSQWAWYYKRWETAERTREV